MGGLVKISIFAVSHRASFRDPFREDSGPHLGPKLGPKPPPEGIPRRLEKRDAKSTPKHGQKGPTWTPRPPPRGSQNRSKIVPGPSPRASMKRPGTKCPLGHPRDFLSGWILVPWAPFQASILNPFGSSRGPQKEPKTGPKTPAIFGQFLIHFGLPGVPGMALGTLGDHLCAGTPEKVDFSCLWGPCRSPLGDPAGTLFRPWTPPGPSWRAFGSDLLAVLVPPGFDPVFRTLKHRKNVVFRSAKSG